MIMTLVRLLRAVLPLVSGDRRPSLRASTAVLERLKALDTNERAGREVISPLRPVATTLRRAAR